MKFEAEGRIEYEGPSDPPGEYYTIDVKNRGYITVGFDSRLWCGNIHAGIPQLNIDSFTNKRCRITIEILDD
jgi:hypothetical protein